jgi:hypothetical protein
MVRAFFLRGPYHSRVISAIRFDEVQNMFISLSATRFYADNLWPPTARIMR